MKKEKGSLVGFFYYRVEEAANYLPRIRERYPQHSYTVRTFKRSLNADNYSLPVVVVVVRAKEKKA